MTLLKDSNYKDINIALLSLEADIKKLSNFDTSAIDKQLADINERIDEINAGSGSSSSSGSSGNNSAEINDLRAEIENIDARVSNNSSEINDIRAEIEDITKTYTIPDVTTTTARYIKLGTFPWHFSETVKAELSGNCFEDTIEFNVLGGNGGAASVNGWYTTNCGVTTGIYVVPVEPDNYLSIIEVWLRVEQLTTLTVKLTGNAIAAQYFNTNPQMNYTQTFPTGAKVAAYFHMKRGYFGYNENTLNCYETNMVGLGFTKDQVVSVAEFAQAVINYTGTNKGRVFFVWQDAGRAYIKATTPYNTQLEINGGTLTFNSRSLDADTAWNTFDAQYINRAGELFTFGIDTDGNNINEYVRKCVDTSGKVATADTVDNYHASDLWRSDGATWNPSANVTMTPTANNQEWSFDFRNKNGATGAFWQIWDENKNEILKVNADDGKVSAPYGFVGNLSGRADNATYASSAHRLTAFASWQNPYDYDSTNGASVFVYKITMASYFNSILVQIYDDINYARCRRYILGLWHINNYGYNVSVTDLGGTKDDALKVWLGNDGNIYLQANVYWTSRISFSRLDDITDVTITKIGAAKYGSNADINGNVLFTPLTDPITDCGALRADENLYSASKVPQILKTDVLKVDGNTTLQGNSNVGLSNYGKEPLSIGTATGENIGIDGDDIQARFNGNASSLDLNYYGGLVRINAQDLTNGGLMVGGSLRVSGHLNIPTIAPTNPERGDIWLVL